MKGHVGSSGILGAHRYSDTGVSHMGGYPRIIPGWSELSLVYMDTQTQGELYIYVDILG